MLRASYILIMIFALLLIPGDVDSGCKKGTVAYNTVTVEPGQLAPPSLRGDICTLEKHWWEDSVLGYYSGFEQGDRTVVYYDPAECSGGGNAVQLKKLWLMLFDPPDSWDPRTYVWPLRLDVVVYDMAVSSDSCFGPGQELCRAPTFIDSASFAFPNYSYVNLEQYDCCVDGPFFIGIEYQSTGGPFPSYMFGTTNQPDTCHIFQWDCDAWYGWYAYWPTVPDYPFMWVEAESPSDLCCPDADGDLVCEPFDNCPNVHNPDQLDTDNDGLGDICDQCPLDPNPGQEDTDQDGIQDACDNCPQDFNASQLDADSDGIGDVCDVCPNDPSNDVDGDGYCGEVDNCPTISNPDQTDSDQDGTGDACETIDGCVGIRGNIDGLLGESIDIADLVFLVDYMFSGGPAPPVFEEADFNGDGSLDVADLVGLVEYMFNGGPPPAPCP